MNTGHAREISRRSFLAGTATLAVGRVLAGSNAAPAGNGGGDWPNIRGFNYQPSYGSSGLELWQKFDATIIKTELARGKKYFPKMNALRWWQSWDAFKRDPQRYTANFAVTLDLAAQAGCKVVPVLFNRWHDSVLDYGGIYIDHFLPRVSWVQRSKMFDTYLEALVGAHATDDRILAWDLCNEPFSYSRPPEEIPDIAKAEFAWLKGIHAGCKQLGVKVPITVGIHPIHGRKGIEQIEPISDVLSIHPYWVPKQDKPDGGKADYEKLLDDYVAFSAQVQKPLLASETCWGELDDGKRVGIIRYTLTQLKQRNIGWLVYLLHHSLIADAHRPEFGPLGSPGNLAFIEADGSLRPGHSVFNEF